VSDRRSAKLKDDVGIPWTLVGRVGAGGGRRRLLVGPGEQVAVRGGRDGLAVCRGGAGCDGEVLVRPVIYPEGSYIVAATVLLYGGCVVPLPCPTPRSGRVTTADGRPLAGAEIRVESWNLSMPGAFKESLAHTSVTRTDADGRWSVPGGAALRFELPIPEMPVVADEVTVEATGMAPEHFPTFFTHGAKDEAEGSSFHVTWDGRPPWSVVTLPVFGFTGGAGQRAAVHVGGMILVGRDLVGAGVRAELAAGINAASAATGLVFTFRAAAPFLGVELNGRYMRPWSSDDGRHVEWGPELGLDVDSWRLTFTALGPSVATPFDRRRVVVGFGWGYF